MAKKVKPSMEELFQTLPEIPEGFEEWCYSFLPKIAIYYRRKGKIAECQCGKCGKSYIVNEQPYKEEPTTCPYCKNKGFYEWKKVTTGRWFNKSLFLMQSTTENNIVVRYFYLNQYFRQGEKAEIKLEETKRVFLMLGDVYYYNFESRWCGREGWKKTWQEGKGYEHMEDGEMYIGWKREIEKSNLKYCDIDLIQKLDPRAKLNILITFANNPALEMYAKAGMSKLVNFLIYKQGKTKWINRRGKSLSAQLRLQDKQKIKRFIKSKGDITLLEILVMEEKSNCNYTIEQEEFLQKMFTGYYNERKKIYYLLKFMTLQQLMNRVEKYKKQCEYQTDTGTVGRYYDYLKMREELGYDMTNEVYLHPRNLKEKHDEMVKERNARKDELHVVKKMQQYPDIAKRYKKLFGKYSYQGEGYFIRPAKDAGEIIMEGRKLHHCVGGDGYLNKHNRGETTILFLRNIETPNEPYYTIEIKDNKILQWYGMKDNKPDKEVIGPWLDKYVESLKKTKKRKKQLLQAAV